MAWLAGASNSIATPDRGADCQGCHTTARNGMTLTNFQTMTNLGAGSFKVFQVRPGQSVPIRLSVTNTYANYYGLCINSLGGSGVLNASHTMTCTPDSAWTDQGGWYTQGPMTTSPQVWTFNLAIASSTPPDYYTIETQMAGLSSSKWAQAETFYVQVLANTASRPALANASCSGAAFSVRVPTTSGSTYYLEYKTNWSSSSWTTVSQTPGDGTTKTLSDPAATDPQRWYRVRVQ
jgi:hypothetical protein